MAEPGLAAYIAREAWHAEEIEPGVWRATFATERDDQFDLVVILGEEAVHFAVTPLAHVQEQADSAAAHRARLFGGLLRLNQQMRLARLALDEDNDVNLIADLPRHGFDYAQFAQVVDLLTQYTDALAHEVRRAADDPAYYSPLLSA